jgi:hypothetical protein
MPASGSAAMAAQDGLNDATTAAAEVTLPSAAPAAHAVAAADWTTLRPFAPQDASLIHLDQFRVDPRFAGINGQGETVAVLGSDIDLNRSFFGGRRFIKTSTPCYTFRRSGAVSRATG